MAQLETMYKGVTNSPSTILTTSIDANSTTIQVENASKLGIVYPNLLVIGDSETAETVIATAVVDNEITIQRGADGTIPQAWGIGSNVARNFTNYDYEKLRSNITALNQDTVSIREDITAVNEQIINPNLLINSNFKVSELVNQREQTSYSGAFGYNIDVWRIFQSPNINVDLTGKYLKLIAVSDLNNSKIYRQWIENFKECSNKTYTLTARVKGDAGVTFNLQVIRDNVGTTSTMENCTGFEQEKKFTFTNGELLTNFGVDITFNSNGNSNLGIELIYLKLEEGSASTPFVDDDPATKLAKCQRYLQKFDTCIGIGYARSSTQLRVQVSYNFRTIPSIIVNGAFSNFIVRVGDGDFVPSNIATSNANSTSGDIIFEIVGATVGQGGEVIAINNANILLSAEL